LIQVYKTAKNTRDKTKLTRHSYNMAAVPQKFPKNCRHVILHLQFFRFPVEKVHRLANTKRIKDY